jgi:hypothetical protein
METQRKTHRQMCHHQHPALPWRTTEAVMEEESVSQVAVKKATVQLLVQKNPHAFQFPVPTQRVSSIVGIRSE